MHTRNKLTLTLALMLMIFFVVVATITLLGFRSYGIVSTDERANLTAEVVKSGLTAHMVNGVMDKRAFFLEQIENVENIESIWIARSSTVIDQYGEGFNNEIARDSIDKEVLDTGERQKVITETTTKTLMRVTIPFVASAFSTPNCLKCHNASEGDVLGVVSMNFDISNGRDTSLVTTLYISIGFIIFAIILLFVLHKFLAPYINIFYSIQRVMQQAHSGDYSARVDRGATGDSKRVADKINDLFTKLERVLKEIDEKIFIFLKNRHSPTSNDPLININNTIEQLANIYKFKQVVESDDELQDIYDRIGYVLENVFGLDEFCLIEINTLSKEKHLVYGQDRCYCGAIDGECRADRTHITVDSILFDHVCELYRGDGDYLCIPYPISNEMSLVLSVTTRNKEKTREVRERLAEIEDYIYTARPAIVSKKLTQILSLVARIDQLTGMYNRKYLDEFVDKAIPQAIRSGITYGILMIDIDFFKMINDTYGHDVGDEGIRVVSKTIKENIRESDIAIRYGGEEFIVLLYNCDKAFTATVADKIRVAFSKEQISTGSDSFTKTLSVGTSQFPEDSDSIWRCIKYADIALYHAKNTGRNRVTSFDKSLIKDSSIGESF